MRNEVLTSKQNGPSLYLEGNMPKARPRSTLAQSGNKQGCSGLRLAALAGSSRPGRSTGQDRLKAKQTKCKQMSATWIPFTQGPFHFLACPAHLVQPPTPALAHSPAPTFTGSKSCLFWFFLYKAEIFSSSFCFKSDNLNIKHNI